MSPQIRVVISVLVTLFFVMRLVNAIRKVRAGITAPYIMWWYAGALIVCMTILLELTAPNDALTVWLLVLALFSLVRAFLLQVRFARSSSRSNANSGSNR